MSSPATPPAPTRKKVRVRRRRSVFARFWWVGALVVLAIAGGIWFQRQLPAPKQVRVLPGYESQAATLDQEVARFTGAPLKDLDVRSQFERAGELATNGEYNGALLLLETVAKKAAVPVVFNDMGVVYAQLGDRGRAVRAFRDALARDFEYKPVRQNLDRLKGFTSNVADPVAQEIEPNNNNELANVIAVGKPVEAEISPLDDDVDVFKVTSPGAPRDLIVIHLENHSKTLAPRLSVYDEEGTILPWGKDQNLPGGSLTQFLAPKPNTTLYLHIFGHGSTSGAYNLSVKALKAFDSYEPNDDIYSATKIQVGQQIEANLMDADDTDFYSFVSPRTGTLTVDIGSRSSTLIPALSTFGPDMRSTGFGPDIRTPGASLRHVISVQEGLTYYIQVWSQGKSSGDYSLKVE